MVINIFYICKIECYVVSMMEGLRGLSSTLFSLSNYVKDESWNTYSWNDIVLED